MSSQSRVLIAGAGIAGLAAALAFQQRGWTVRVFERAPALREVGAGIQLAPNGMKVLRALGLEQGALQAGFLPEALEMRMGRSGLPIFNIPIRHSAQYRWRAPYLHIHRADLVSLLARALQERAPGSLVLGRSVIGCSDTGVTLDDGSTDEGDLVVGADGLRSGLRAQAFGDEPARYTGMVAWRGTVQAANLGAHTPPKTACVWAGPGRHVVSYFVRRNGLVNFVGVVEKDLPTPERLDSWTTAGAVEEAVADFDGWQEPVLRMIEGAQGLSQWALFDRPHTKAWVKGRMVLIGDAAHPMLPTFAQGGCQALEDAWALAALADRAPDLELGLKAFETLRQPRTFSIQQRAKRNARDFHHQPGFEQIRAYSTLWFGGRFLRPMAKARLDPIYGYDIVEEVAKLSL